MSRAALLRWGCRPAAGWARPERLGTPAGQLDRWLNTVGARAAHCTAWFERRRLARFADRTGRLGAALRALPDDALKQQARSLQQRLHREGITDALAAQGLALAGEASFRWLGKRPYPVQLMGAYGLLQGRMIEMATGEGKTLTAALPCLTLALAGIPVHIVSLNDYLARRDGAIARQLLAPFGLTVGVVTHVEDDEQKRAAYLADVTYCVDKDLVFDYLRDSLRPGPRAGSGPAHCQRGLYFALVDEADSILVDEARTPLVIARERPMDQERVDAAMALELARMLDPCHFRPEPGSQQFRLTAQGRALLKAQHTRLACASHGWSIAQIREERVEQALSALHGFRRGAHYVIRDAKVQIVDESTGRILPDRSWQRGLHQMIELKEQLDLTAPRETIASHTYPEFFARYLRIAGMTGTAREVAGEIRANFGMRTIAIPPHRPSIRRFLGVRLFVRSAQRWEAIAARAIALAQAGRAVLIGTKSVLASEQLSAVLAKLGQPHQVLNALNAELEAAVVAQAGQRGRVTVATNMAGRGTDIELHPAVRECGGLHVILSEFHESRRVDRQLYGRAARQGDPGSCEAMVSLEDELFMQFTPWLARVLRRRYAQRCELPPAWHYLLQYAAQARAESRNARIRSNSMASNSAMRRAVVFSGARK